ncbi:Uncharacterized protein DAT39_002886, partial [Clarias magur]
HHIPQNGIVLICGYSRVSTQLAVSQILHSTMSSITWPRASLKCPIHVTMIRRAMIVLENGAWDDYGWCPSMSLPPSQSHSTIKTT